MKVIIAAVLGLLLVNGAGSIQAEKAVIEVPFESHGTSCWYDEIKIEYHCTWKGEIKIFTLDDLEEFKEMVVYYGFSYEVMQINLEEKFTLWEA